MPFYESGDLRLHYEERGDGFPVLLIAPGGMKSAISFWEAMPWNPLVELSGDYRVIAMDQRNAGTSTGPVGADDGWHTYAADQLALVDHLGVDRFHVMGMCIGGPYAMGLIQAAPQRVASAVIFQSIGLMAGAKNRPAFYDMFDGWAEALKPQHTLSDAGWSQFRSNMYDGDDFLFNVGDEELRQCATPLCLLEGDDLYHPKETSLKLRELAPHAHYIEQWKTEEARPAAMAQVRAFLAANS